MSIHQLSDGRWFVRYEKGRDPDRPGSTRTYFGRGDEAREQAERYNEALGLGTRTIRRSYTVTALANEYLDSRRATMTSTGYARITTRLAGTLLPFFGRMQAHTISHSVLDSWVSSRLQTVKSVSVRNDLSVLRTILKWSVDRRLIAANPMEGYPLPRDDSAILRPPTRQEIDALVQCASPHMQRIIMLAYHTGIRPGPVELYSLQWTDVDLADRTVTVTSAEKGGLPVRIVPLNGTIHALLTAWYDIDRASGIRWVVSYGGERVESAKTAWRLTKQRARITRRMRLYDLRHAFITSLLDAGADLKSVSEIVGHSSVDLTLRVYRHTSSESKRRAVDLVG